MPYNPCHSGQLALSDALHITIRWVEAMHGRGDLTACIRYLADVLNGHRGSIIRIGLDTSVESVLAWSNGIASASPARKQKITFPQYLLGHGLGQAQPGSIWYLSELAKEIAHDETSGARLCPTDHQTREIAVVVLEPRALTSDILELQFPRRLSTRETEALSSLSAVLSRGWRHRNPLVYPTGQNGGFWTDLESEDPPVGAILVPENPAKLSRSEYRVCELVSRGLSAKAICEKLRISESTVRSHLRSIYAKTGTTGQRELMFNLLAYQGGHATVAPRGAEYAAGRIHVRGSVSDAD